MDKKKNKSFVLDIFTQRLLVVYDELVKLDAMPDKSEFSIGLGIVLNTFNKIETHQRNFPKKKIDIAKKYLYTYFFVSKAYWDTAADMFYTTPTKRRFTQRPIEHNFRDLRSKEALYRALAEAENNLKSKDEEIALLKEQLVEYKKTKKK